MLASSEKLSLRWAWILVALAVIVAYSTGFSGDFLFDDVYHVTENPAIRSLWPPWASMFAPVNATRPLVGLSFAINYAISGLEIWSYQAFNLIYHVGAALFLMGIVRRCLRSPRWSAKLNERATEVAVAVGVLWATHPLNTQAVAYVTQRFQSLMGFFFLATLYAALRFFDANNKAERQRWQIFATLLCALGMWCKQDMVTAPLAVLFYDALFHSDSLGAAIRKRAAFYTGLGATLTLLVLAHFAAPRGAFVGANSFTGLAAGPYALTQLGVIPYYLRLALWPHPLCFDYYWPIAHSLSEVMPEALLVPILLGATIWGYLKKRPWSFVGIWCVLTLALSSSFLPIQDAIWEYRMYLPLTALIAGVVALAANYTLRSKWLWICGAIAIVFTLTSRNEVSLLRNDFELWNDVTIHRPRNPRAWNNLGLAWEKRGDLHKAWDTYLIAEQIEPRFSYIHLNLGKILMKHQKFQAAADQFRVAVQTDAANGYPHGYLANALEAQGKTDEALAEYREGLRLSPNYSEMHNDYGALLLKTGDVSGALREFEESIRLNGLPIAHINQASARSILKKNQRQ